MKEEEDKKNKLNEPKALYTCKSLKIYFSFDEAAKAEAIYNAKQNPIDRIKETVQLILRVFPLSEKKSNTDKIYIDKS